MKLVFVAPAKAYHRCRPPSARRLPFLARDAYGRWGARAGAGEMRQRRHSLSATRTLWSL